MVVPLTAKRIGWATLPSARPVDSQWDLMAVSRLWAVQSCTPARTSWMDLSAGEALAFVFQECFFGQFGGMVICSSGRRRKPLFIHVAEDTHSGVH